MNGFERRVGSGARLVGRRVVVDLEGVLHGGRVAALASDCEPGVVYLVDLGFGRVVPVLEDELQLVYGSQIVGWMDD